MSSFRVVTRGAAITLCCVGMIGCTKARYAQTNIGQALTTPVRQTFTGGVSGEVICNEGTVCADVEVLRVHADPRDGGGVQVLLHNRTGKSVNVQIALWVLSPEGALLDQTPFQDVPLPPRQEKMWETANIHRAGAKLQVRLRAPR